jgi:integrase
MSSFSVGTKKCKKCGANLLNSRKYKVAVILPSGRWKTKTVESLELARSLEAKYRDDLVRKGELGLLKAPLIDEVWESLYEEAKRTLKHPSHPEKRWRCHVRPYFTGWRLDAITPRDVQKFITELSKKRIHKKNLDKKAGTKQMATSTLVSCVKLLGRLFNHAIGVGMYDGDNPVRRVKLPKFNNQVTNPLTKDELERLLATLDEWPNRLVALALELCLITGKRTGEVFLLTWDNIDLENGLLRFQVKSQIHGEYQWLPITRRMGEILDEARRQMKADVPLVFHTETGKRIHYRAIWLRIKKTAKLRGEIRPHDLRHTFASRLACSGEVDIYTIQKLLGHKTISMTQRYAHLMDSVLRQGLGVAERVLGIK